ncbi:hypothetical protein SAMN05192529_11162 [Arachidicoccus rhizosphaerae]|jgi:hypothetical protein|uniref:Uncharacterized protein n=1 Tax=Arachidicoccus rhizosphaerae TaxID=551991 RepID=A0A1H3ZK41_9BACT|nr:hypothetical protein [Arachidicoccus rhizosphaerae]SEA23791.1 hypothetical protein SAMN05192529_11162 [Arachidicoccus rhizosphaerae]
MNPTEKKKRVKDPRENKYQIGIIVSLIFMIIYGYSLYIAVRLGRTTKIYMNGGIMFGWFLLCLYWLRQLGLLHKQNQSNQDLPDDQK